MRFRVSSSSIRDLTFGSMICCPTFIEYLDRSDIFKLVRRPSKWCVPLTLRCTLVPREAWQYAALTWRNTFWIFFNAFALFLPTSSKKRSSYPIYKCNKNKLHSFLWNINLKYSLIWFGTCIFNSCVEGGFRNKHTSSSSVLIWDFPASKFIFWGIA